MNQLLNTKYSLALIVVAFIVFAMVNTLLFQGFRIDFTENKLFTLSDGSKEIINSVEEPLVLSLFYSKKQMQDYPSINNYAKRVEELLEEYQSLSKGKIDFRLIDPEPFSEQEDQANEFGLQSVPVGKAGDTIYFGLVAQKEEGEEGVNKDVNLIPFFQLDKEEFLEYDISKLIYRTSKSSLPVMAVYSGLSMTGGFDPMTQQSTPPWMIYEQLGQTFQMRNLATDFSAIDADVDVLMLVHPKALAEESLYAIDQYVLGGGHALVFVDPYAESDVPPAAMAGMMPPGEMDQSSDLPGLFTSWGVEFDKSKVLGDAEYALQVAAPSGQAIRHLGLLGFNKTAMSSDDLVTMHLESINMGAAGIIAKASNGQTKIQNLVQSSVNAQGIDAAIFPVLRDPRMLQRGFQPDGEQKAAAVRISGAVTSSFNDSEFLTSDKDKSEKHIASNENINIIVVADTDLLTDRYWVRIQHFFGQRIASPWADNANFVTNAVDNLSGSSALISIRSRGQFSRPFSLVKEMQQEAEAAFLLKQESLQGKLAQTEQKLNELQQAKGEVGGFVLNQEQKAELEKFQSEKLAIRKQLREVQHQLNADIENLGTILKLLNTFLVPSLLCIISIIVWRLRINRPRGI